MIKSTENYTKSLPHCLHFCQQIIYTLYAILFCRNHPLKNLPFQGWQEDSKQIEEKKVKRINHRICTSAFPFAIHLLSFFNPTFCLLFWVFNSECIMYEYNYAPMSAQSRSLRFMIHSFHLFKCIIIQPELHIFMREKVQTIYSSIDKLLVLP